jgi:hypothetical protein
MSKKSYLAQKANSGRISPHHRQNLNQSAPNNEYLE